MDRLLISPRQLSAVSTVFVATALVMSGCFLDRGAISLPQCDSNADCQVGEQCRDGQCWRADAGRDGGVDSGVDGGPLDAGVDGGTDDAGRDSGPPDAGPTHCRDGVLTPALESDVDCGRECAPCGMCRRCVDGADCGNGMCAGGVCRPVPTEITTSAGPRNAFVREDGAILLAHYAPGTYHVDYDPSVLQQTSVAGGSTPPTTWAPDPCQQAGHLPLPEFDSVGRAVTIECGTSYSDVRLSASSTVLFGSFEGGTWGTFGAAGLPGWGAVAAIGSGLGRSMHGMCGDATTSSIGGIAYCDGRRTALLYDNHLASYSVVRGTGNPYVGCDRMGCNGATCTFGIWVWLHP